MKFFKVLLVSILPLLLAACQTPRSSVPPSITGEISATPHLGMSKAQIRAIYGEPNLVNGCPCCEDWFYWFTPRHVLIPGHAHAFAHTGAFIFDANGRLKDFAFHK
jgi:outer membrane protein assembly factor BamE (lipoprotein component of BamABCDE complex)